MRGHQAWVVLLAMGVGACSFILDFDALQEGDATATVTTAGGSSGSGGVGGSMTTSEATSSSGTTTGAAGAAGQAGGATCAMDCDDSDPCTLDSCDTSVDPPECSNLYQAGVVADGFEATLEGDQFQRVVLVAGPSRFYMSVFATPASGSETLLYGLGRDETELELLFDAADLGVLGEPRSVMGLIPDASSGFTLHAYLAFDDQLGANDALGRVYYVAFDDFVAPTPELVSTAYDARDPLRFPKTLVLGSGIYGAWITPTGAIEMHDAGSGSSQMFHEAQAVIDPATTLSTLASPSLPGVAYTTESGDVFAEIQGAAPNAMNRCLPGDVAFQSMTSASVQLAGAWFVNWTAFGQDELGSETKVAFCADAGCVSDACDPGSEVFNFTRNPALATATRQGDDPGVVYVAVATPSFVTDTATVADAELRLALLRVGFGENPGAEEVVTEILAEMSVARTPTDLTLKGPNFPALSFLPPDKLGIAWIEPSATSALGALRVRRYELCLPEQ